jgi:hypothetical protein
VTTHRFVPNISKIYLYIYFLILLTQHPTEVVPVHMMAFGPVVRKQRRKAKLNIDP